MDRPARCHDGSIWAGCVKVGNVIARNSSVIANKDALPSFTYAIIVSRCIKYDQRADSTRAEKLGNVWCGWLVHLALDDHR